MTQDVSIVKKLLAISVLEVLQFALLSVVIHKFFLLNNVMMGI